MAPRRSPSGPAASDGATSFKNNGGTSDSASAQKQTIDRYGGNRYPSNYSPNNGPNNDGLPSSSEGGAAAARQRPEDLEADSDALGSGKESIERRNAGESESDFNSRKANEDNSTQDDAGRQRKTQEVMDSAGKGSWFRDKLTPGKVIPLLGGISLLGWVIHLGILKDQNDGARIRVTNISVQKGGGASARKVLVTYDPNDATTRASLAGGTKISPDYVKPAIGDWVSFDANCKLGTPRRQIKNSQDEVIELTLSDNDLTSPGYLPRSGTPGVTCVQSPTPNCYSPSFVDGGGTFSLDVNGYMTLSTTFTNHMAQNIGESFYFAGQVLTLAINAAAPVLDAAVRAGTGAAKTGFCTAMPIFCDSTIWLVILIGIVAMIIFTAVS